MRIGLADFLHRPINSRGVLGQHFKANDDTSGELAAIVLLLTGRGTTDRIKKSFAGRRFESDWERADCSTRPLYQGRVGTTPNDLMF